MQAEAITEYSTAALQHGLCVDGVLYASSAAGRGAGAATTSGLMQPQLTSLPDILAMSRLYKVSKVCRQRSRAPASIVVHCMLHPSTATQPWRQAARTAQAALIHHGHHPVMHCAQALNLAGKLGLFTTLCEQGQWPMVMVAGRQAGRGYDGACTWHASNRGRPACATPRAAALGDTWPAQRAPVLTRLLPPVHVRRTV